MRITNSMMADQFLLDANESLNRLAKAQQQVDSTKKINGIEDDPLATMASLKARNKLSSLSEYQDSVSTATSYLKENGNAVDSLNSVIQSAYELIVSANSGGKTAGNLADIGNEVAGLRDEVFSIANSTLGTAYLFSGNSSKTPFTIGTDGHLSYNGVDLSAYALRDEVSAQITSSAAAYNKISVKQANASDSVLNLLGSSTDATVKNVLVPDILDALDTMITNGNTSIQSAKQFDSNIDTSDLKTAIDGLSVLRDNLNSANSKSIGDTSGNAFSIAEITKIVNGDSSTTPATIGLTGSGGMYTTYTDALGAVQTAMNGSAKIGSGASLGTESLASRELQVGKTQTVQYTVNGLDLMGISVSVTKDADGNVTGASTNSSNASNLYYILDKCVNILNGNLDSSLLGEMSTALQSIQSNVLGLDTQIGTSQNRMSMLTDRYTASKLTYKGMQSDAEDADMAAAAVELSTAKTVYDAALTAGAKIVQTSLVDFLS